MLQDLREQPRHEVHGAHGHAHAEDHAGQGPLGRTFAEGEHQGSYDNRHQCQAGGNRASESRLQRLHSLRPGRSRGLGKHTSSASAMQAANVSKPFLRKRFWVCLDLLNWDLKNPALNDLHLVAAAISFNSPLVSLWRTNHARHGSRVFVGEQVGETLLR